MTPGLPPIRIAVFGALEIIHGQQPPRRPPTQRVLALLGLLIAQHDVPQRRDKLVDVLWPDLLPRQGRRVLSDTLWRTRRLLACSDADDTPLLLIGGDTVTFRPAPDTHVDLLAFERLVRAASPSAEALITDEIAASLREAVELYRGDFLEDCYDDWALFERERLRELYLSAVQRLLTHYQQQQSYDAAVQMALRLVHADPLREDAHRALMRLYYLLGREADALRAYEQCRTVLDAELGVEPDIETVSLYEELTALQARRLGGPTRAVGERAAEPPRAATIARELALVGRQRERAELTEVVEQAIAGFGGLVLLEGAAGLGKTRLLSEVAAGARWRGAQISWGRGREDAQALPFGALRAALGELLTPARARQLASLLPAHMLSTLLPLLPQLADLLPDLSLSAPSGERQAALLHAAIGRLLAALGTLTPQVLVLEDLHWFDAATLAALATIAPLLADARVLILLSGRSDAIPQREAVWSTLLQLDRQGALRRVELHPLNEHECAELIRRALHLRQPAPRFSQRVWESTGGNPHFVLETLRALVEQRLLTRDASGGWHTPWDHEATDYRELPLPDKLQAAIAGRLQELGAAERQALAAAAVLGQNFAPATWARMSAAPDVPRELLLRQFLVEDAAGYRFGHETLREVIYEELDGPTRQTLHLRAAEALEQEYYAQVEALGHHLYLAGAWGKALPYLLQAGDRAKAVYAWQDALRFYDQAREVARQDPAADAATTWTVELKRGAAATPLGDYATAIEAYETVLDLTDEDGGPEARARVGARRSAQIQALNGLCFVYGLRNDYALAREMIKRAEVLATESPRLIDRAEVTYQAGLISYRMNDYAEARRFLDEANKLYESLDLDTERANCLSIIGWCFLRQDGPTNQVIEYFTQALDIYRRQGDRFREHDSLLDIANVHLMAGHLVEVLQAIEQCIPFFNTVNAADSVATCLFTRGEAYRRMGRLEEALTTLQESFAICTRLERNAAATFSRVFIATTLRDMGRLEEAMVILEQLLSSDDRLIKVRALLVASGVWRGQGQLERAWCGLKDVFVLAQRLGSKVYTGIAYRLLAQLRIADTRRQLPPPDPAAPDIEPSFVESVHLLQAAHCDDELALTSMAYGRYLVESDRPLQAQPILIQAQMLLQRCGMTIHLEIVQQMLRQLVITPPTPCPNQLRVRLARQGAPRGRPLRSDELAEVVWTVESAEDYTTRIRGGKVAERHARIRRLCAEAVAQGAEPTVADLASALGVAARTVDRDIAAMRAAGEHVITRGAAA